LTAVWVVGSIRGSERVDGHSWGGGGKEGGRGLCWGGKKRKRRLSRLDVNTVSSPDELFPLIETLSTK